MLFFQGLFLRPRLDDDLPSSPLASFLDPLGGGGLGTRRTTGAREVYVDARARSFGAKVGWEGFGG